MDNVNAISEDIENVSISNSLSCSPESCAKHLNKFPLKIIHLNIRSINCNFDKLQVLLHRTKVQFDIIILSECWLSRCSDLPPLSGYDSYKTSCTNQNDGVVAYVRTELTHTVDFPVFNGANCLVIKLGQKVAIVALYRSPSTKKIDPFIDSLDYILANLKRFKITAIMGDMNIDISLGNTDSHSNIYLNLLAFNGILPAHCLPTRENRCLDHVLLRSTSDSIALTLNTSITDHLPIILACDSLVSIRQTHKIKSHFNVKNAVSDLESTNFSDVLNSNNANDAANSFTEILTGIVHKNSNCTSVPSKKTPIKPWMTPGLLKCIRHRDRLFVKAKKHTNNHILLITYKRYRTFCNNLLKRIKSEYERSELQKSSKNPKATWKIIKEIANLNKRKTGSSNLLSSNGTTSASVNAVNNYFANVGKNLASQILNSSNYVNECTNRLITQNPYPLNSMVLASVDDSEINNTIVHLKDKSSVGWDSIPTSLIKAARHVLVPILKMIFNLCLESGIFPDCFKKAIVHPIYKSGDRDSSANYRPISILSVVSKIFEKILNSRLLSYLNTHNILSPNQFGFRREVGTEDAVLDLTNSIVRHLDKKQKTLAIFLDLCKAFDTVSIPLLLAKLEKIGIRGIALNIFESYLTNRTQSVVIDGIKSVEVPIIFGVPQGSVLGPTLFLIYINDLCNLALPNCRIVTYADDTALLINGKSWSELHLLAESAMSTVVEWLSSNLLSLNLSKTKYITFALRHSVTLDSFPPLRTHSYSSGSPHPFSCNCPSIERTSSIKYLGVIIDSSMSWNLQIEQTASRTRKLIYIFSKLRNILTHTLLKTVYFTLVQSTIGYCITAWGGSAKTSMIRVERAQRAVLKVIHHKPFRFSTSELYSLSCVLSVRRLFVLNTTLRKHRKMTYELSILDKRRSDKVCEIESRRTAAASRCNYLIASRLYNKINFKLNIYSLTKHKCKEKIMLWLLNLSYDETEDLLKAI